MNSLLKMIRKKLSKPIYVQIWEHRIRAVTINSDGVFDEKPLVAIKTTSRDQKQVIEIGNSAEFSNRSNTVIVNPFSHPRVLLNDFQVGEKLLQHISLTLHKNPLIRPAPVIILHPMEKLEGGLTQIEKRAFRELAFGAGASEIYLYSGTPLVTQGVDLNELTARLEDTV